MPDRLWNDDEWRAAMSTAEINDLPDSDFAYIEPGGEKDSEGKTTPRSLRHFPINDAAHVRNALARLSTSPFGDKAKPKVMAAAKKFGIEVSESNAEADDHEHRHAAFTGTHTHAHAAMGDQGGDETHEHSHSHDGDSDHDHGHARARRTPDLAERAELHHFPEERQIQFTDAECRMESGSGGMTFRGYASIFNSPYPIQDAYGEYQESVQPEAFDRSLAQKADVVFLINHKDAPLARTKSGTLSLSRDAKGLIAEARLDPANPRAQELKSMVDRGDMDEMSFTFRDLLPTWNASFTERSLRQVELNHGDVSAVNFGANGATKGTLAMRSRQWVQYGPTRDAFLAFVGELSEGRAGAALSSTSQATLKHILSLVSSADTAVDEAQPLLAGLLGVPNPDIAQDAALDRSEAPDDESRNLGEGCNCCTDCMGAQCDGSCCERCAPPPNTGTVGNEPLVNGPDDSPPTASQVSLGLKNYDAEARIAILRLKKGRP